MLKPWVVGLLPRRLFLFFLQTVIYELRQTLFMVLMILSHLWSRVFQLLQLFLRHGSMLTQQLQFSVHFIDALLVSLLCHQQLQTHTPFNVLLHYAIRKGVVDVTTTSWSACSISYSSSVTADASSKFFEISSVLCSSKNLSNSKMIFRYTC